MSDIALAPAQAGTNAPAHAEPFRGGRFADIDLVHARLHECIWSLPYYNDEFKAYETARLSKDYLAALIEQDPYHVMIYEIEGKPYAFQISGPELGTLWLYWSYVFPEMRTHTRSSFLRDFTRHWDNGRFHKISTYTMAANERAKIIMQRYGFKLTAVLEKQIFGEDYMLYEHMLTKTLPGYDIGVKTGIMHRLRRKAMRLLGLR